MHDYYITGCYVIQKLQAKAALTPRDSPFPEVHSDLQPFDAPETTRRNFRTPSQLYNDVDFLPGDAYLNQDLLRGMLLSVT